MALSLKDVYEKIGLIEYITVPQNHDLVITNGPFIIPSQYDFKDPLPDNMRCWRERKTICRSI